MHCSVVLCQKMTIQEKLGYPKDAKLVIIHADDVGVSNSETNATIAAMEKGSVSSASLMVPCPWFPKIAAYCRTHPSADFGLHLTLTSEWKYYRWGPVSSVSEVPQLVNNQGFLFSTVDSVVKNVNDVHQIETEIRNQVKRAIQFGVDPTHFDTHMRTLHSNADFLKAMIKVGHEFKIPFFVSRALEKSLKVKFDTLLSPNDVVIDYALTLSPEDFKTGQRQFYIKTLNSIKPGLTYLVIHTAFDDEEMKAITEDHDTWHAPWRQQDYNFFTSDECRQLLKKNNIYVITWREIRDKITRS